MKSNFKPFLVTIISFVFTLQLHAQDEICTDGIDNNGDGFVDCYDELCSDGDDCSDFFVGNDIECRDEPTDDPTFSMRLQWGSPDESANSHSSPAVGDIDSDGTPEVIATNKQNKTISILDGVFGNYDQNIKNASGQEEPYVLDYEPENAVVIGDIDGGDGYAEIVVVEDKGRIVELLRYDENTQQLYSDWKVTFADNVGMPGMADFNGDGIVEIYFRDVIIDARDGSTIVNSAGGDWQIDYAHGAIAVDILPDAFCANCSGLELITGADIWAVSIPNGGGSGSKSSAANINDLINADLGNNIDYHVKYYNNWKDQWTSISVADFDQDGDMDVLMSGALGEDYTDPTTIFYWDVNEGEYYTYADPSNDHPRGTGRINIADVNGDGNMNAIYISDQKLYALAPPDPADADPQLSTIWVKGVKEGSSGFTGCTLFDFNGDGAFETIYRSESELYIIDGTDGSTSTTLPCVSRTQEEYPIVADVDNDGSSEICVPCYTSDATPFNPYSNTRFSQIRVFEASGGEIWQPSRTVWNQHGYYNVNINDDLTIPVQQQDHTAVFGNVDCETGAVSEVRALNGFLNQSTYIETTGCPSYVSPDINLLQVSDATVSQCPETEFTVTFDIRNDGDTDISGSLPVTFYAGDPTIEGSTRLNTEVLIISDFTVGSTQTLSTTADGPGGEFELFVVINDNGSSDPPISLNSAGIAECETDNNIGSIIATYEPFSITTEKIKDNEKCFDEYPDNGQARAFYFGAIDTGSETFWLEDFQDLSDGDVVDNGDTQWSISGGSSGSWGVGQYSGGNAFIVNKSGGKNLGGMITWSSEDIDISGHSDVSFSIDLIASSAQESSGDWRDIQNVYYTLDGGTRESVTAQAGSFDFYQASVSELNGTTLKIEVEVHNTGSNEYMEFDNIVVEGTPPPTAGELTETDGFIFNWYRDGDFSAPVYTGSLYADMADGTYDVVALYTESNCYSDTSATNQIVITRETPEFTVLITEISPLTNCTTPDGELAVSVIELDENGDPDTVDTGYSFTWYVASEGVTPIATGTSLVNRSADTYSVTVVNQTSGCIENGTGDISTALVLPAAPTITVTHVTDCDNIESGIASASVGGNTSDYDFLWYHGSIVTPSEDAITASYEDLAPGVYTVVARDKTTLCESVAVTDTIDAPDGYPFPTTTLINHNTSCDTPNGSVSADADGNGTVTGYTFEWYYGDNTSNSNKLPNNGHPNIEVSDDGSTLTGLDASTYTVKVINDATNCFDTDTISIEDNSIAPDWNFVEQVDAGLSVDIQGKAYVTMPQLIGGQQGITISYWANLSANNYLNDHIIFSSGGSSESQTILWTDNTDGLAFVVKAENDGGRGRINTTYKPTGWTQVTGTWSFESGIMKIYANGVLIGSEPYAGTPDGLYNAGTEMYLGRDGNAGVNKFSGEVDEFRLYDRALSESEIATLLCDPNSGSTDGILANYDFNTDMGTTQGSTIPDASGNGNDAFVDWNGSANNGSLTYTDSDIQCPISDQATANTSCDPDNPNGQIDLRDGVDPTTASYTYTLYSGYTTDTQIAQNTTGVFSNLSDGFYTVMAGVDGCETAPLSLSIPTIEDSPIISESTTDDLGCEIGSGTITLTTSTNLSGEPDSYTYEIFNGQNTTDLLQQETVTDGSTGFTFTGLAEGVYRVRVTNDSIQCQSTKDIIVSNSSVDPTWDTGSTNNFDNTSCDENNPNGQLQVFVTGGNTDYTFTWYDGSTIDAAALRANDTTNTLASLGDTTYTVVATSNVTGCSTTPYTLTIVNDLFVPDIQIAELSEDGGCGVGSGQLEGFVIEDGTGNLLDEDASIGFQWYKGTDTSIPDSLSGDDHTSPDTLSAGVYTLLVFDSATSCTATQQFTLNRNPVLPAIVSATTAANTSCNDANYTGGVTLVVSFDGTNPVVDFNGYSFDWYVGNDDSGTPLQDNVNASDGSIPQGANTESITGLYGGQYTVVITAPNGCESVEKTYDVDFTPTLPAADTLAAGTNSNTVCNNDLALANSSAYNGQITLDFSSGSGGVAGDYSYQWFVGQSTASGDALTTAISGSDVSTAGVAANIPGGTYTVIIQNTSTQCSDTLEFALDDATATAPVIDNTTPEVDYDVDSVTLCSGTPDGSIELLQIDGSTDLSGFYFLWYSGSDTTSGTFLGNNAAVDSTSLLDNQGAGQYTVIAIDSTTGCASAEVTFQIDEDLALPTATQSAYGAGSTENSVCDSDLTIGANYSGILQITPDYGVVGDFSYEWHTGSAGAVAASNIVNTTTIPGVAGETSNTLSNIPGGTYSVIMSHGTNGCTDTLQFSLTDNVGTAPAIDMATPEVDYDVDSVTVCSGTPDGSIQILEIDNSTDLSG
ncbi:MAG: hypothetical protein JXQ90_24030, partial [Cyclobacteriaceae bacterium]